MRAKRFCAVSVFRSVRSTGLLALPLLLLLMVLTSADSFAQTTEFTYQGSLHDDGVPTDGDYDFQFALFGQLAAGAQVGTTVTRTNISVAEGIFSVELDFGSQFPGADRYLEIRVRPAGGGAYTTLAPRQRIASVPYAINAKSLGGVAANQYVLTGDARLLDPRDPLPGSGNYIQNTTDPQPSTNFNISGNGTIGGTLTVPYGTQAVPSITFAGDTDTGMFRGSGGGLNFAVNGSDSLSVSPSGIGFTGDGNRFIGVGQRTTDNADGSSLSVRSGSPKAGSTNRNGGNLFLNTGFSTGTGSGSILFLTPTPTSSGTSTNFVSAKMVITGPGNVGIGTTTPNHPLHIATNSSHIAVGSSGCGSGFVGIAFGSANPNCLSYSILGDGTDTMLNAPGAGTIYFRVGNITRATINASGILGLPNLGVAGSTSLCRNASNQVATCSSSIRYKSSIDDFAPGLDVIKRLRPVSFTWNDSGSPDLGLIAEEVAGIEPLLSTLNPDGSSEGVKYDRLGVVLVNAIKEQQRLIDQQDDIIQQQRAEIERILVRQLEFEAELKVLVCSGDRDAAVCQGEPGR